MREIEFLFDFGSPNAFLAHRAIPAIEAQDTVRFTYVPVLLGGIFKATGNQSPMQAWGHVAPKRAYDRLEMERFCAAHGIDDFAMNPHFPVNMLAIMRGAVAAHGWGMFEAYVEAMFAGMWAKELKLDDLAVIAATLDAAGLPAAELMAEAQSDVTKQSLATTTAHAVHRGVFGSPSFFVGEALYFGKDRLRDAVEAAMRQR